jgi:hypothetical protein
VSYVFGKPLALDESFPKTYDMPPFLAIKKIQSPSDNGGVLDGNQIFSITIQYTPTIKW